MSINSALLNRSFCTSISANKCPFVDRCQLKRELVILTYSLLYNDYLFYSAHFANQRCQTLFDDESNKNAQSNVGLFVSKNYDASQRTCNSLQLNFQHQNEQFWSFTSLECWTLTWLNFIYKIVLNFVIMSSQFHDKLWTEGIQRKRNNITFKWLVWTSFLCSFQQINFLKSLSLIFTCFVCVFLYFFLTTIGFKFDVQFSLCIFFFYFVEFF